MSPTRVHKTLMRLRTKCVGEGSEDFFFLGGGVGVTWFTGNKS